MSANVPLTKAEQDLLGAMARFAAARAQNGVYLNQGHSKSLGCPVLFLCALGDQALALQKVIFAAAERESLIVPGTAANQFAGGENAE